MHIRRECVYLMTGLNIGGVFSIKMRVPKITNIFHTRFAVHHGEIAVNLRNRPSTIITPGYVHVPFYVTHIDRANRGIVGSMPASIWTDVWRSMTDDFRINYTYLPHDVGSEVSVLMPQSDTTWHMYDTHAALTAKITIPRTGVDAGDVVLFSHFVADKNNYLF